MVVTKRDALRPEPPALTDEPTPVVERLIRAFVLLGFLATLAVELWLLWKIGVGLF